MQEPSQKPPIFSIRQLIKFILNFWWPFWPKILSSKKWSITAV
jgi:hypothetical protein